MQETIKNMMDELMKNASTFKPFDLPKNDDLFKSFNLPQNADLFKELSNSKTGIQLLDFQKSIFNNSYNTMIKIQAQSEKMTDSFLKENSAIPAESKKVLNEWKIVLKKGQTDFKKSVDDSFIKAESYLNDTKKEAKAK